MKIPASTLALFLAREAYGFSIIPSLTSPQKATPRKQGSTASSSTVLFNRRSKSGSSTSVYNRYPQYDNLFIPPIDIIDEIDRPPDSDRRLEWWDDGPDYDEPVPRPAVNQRPVAVPDFDIREVDRDAPDIVDDVPGYPMELASKGVREVDAEPLPMFAIDAPKLRKRKKSRVEWYNDEDSIDVTPPQNEPVNQLQNFYHTDPTFVENVWEDLAEPTTVQGGALRTWSYPTPDLERLFVKLETPGPEAGGPPEGNPLHVELEIKQGANTTPQRVVVKSGKGRLRPFQCMIETPGGSSSLFVRNKDPSMCFPFNAKVGSEFRQSSGKFPRGIRWNDQDEKDHAPKPNAGRGYMVDERDLHVIQGGDSCKYYEMPGEVQQVKVVLTSKGRPLNAKVELIQGPNAPKYELEIFSQEGSSRPFVTVLECPGDAPYVVRVVNTGSPEFPIHAGVEPVIMEVPNPPFMLESNHT